MLRTLNAFLYLYHCFLPSPAPALSFRGRVSFCHEEAPIFLLSCPQTNGTYCPQSSSFFAHSSLDLFELFLPVYTALPTTALVTRTVMIGLCYS